MSDLSVVKVLARSFATSHTRRRALLASVASALGVVRFGRGATEGGALPVLESVDDEGAISFIDFVNVLIVDGFVHEQVHELDGVEETVEVIPLEYFPARRPHQLGPCEPSSPVLVDRAKSQAERARSQGIDDELTALGIHEFGKVLESWQAVLMQ